MSGEIKGWRGYVNDRINESSDVDWREEYGNARVAHETAKRNLRETTEALRVATDEVSKLEKRSLKDAGRIVELQMSLNALRLDLRLLVKHNAKLQTSLTDSVRERNATVADLERTIFRYELLSADAKPPRETVTTAVVAERATWTFEYEIGYMFGNYIVRPMRLNKRR